MISENEARTILRSAIFAFCTQQNIVIFEGSQISATYTFADDELKRLRDSRMHEDAESYVTDLAKRLATGDSAVQELTAMRRIFGHLIHAMGGEIVISSSELVAMENWDIEVLQLRDPYTVKIKAVKRND